MRISKKETAETQRRALEIINRVSRQAPALRDQPLPARIDALRAILRSKKPIHERLATVREMLPAERNEAQRTLVWAHACALEVNSAGLPMLFERFGRREIARVDRALEAIGARETRRGLARLRARVEKAVKGGRSWARALEELEDDPLAERSFERTETYVAEIEQRLLAYCEAQVERLAAR